MKITNLRTEVVEFPYDRPMGLSANYILRTGSCVLVFLESDQGVVGEGLVYSFNGDRIKIYNDFVLSFAPLVVGKDPTQSGAIFTSLWNNIKAHGQSGFAINALSGVDCALWDLRAKLAGLNVANLIGSCRTTMPVYNSGDYWSYLSIDDFQKNAAAHMAQGYRAFKLRLTTNIAENIARVKAVREVIGDKNDLLVDLNQHWNLPNAIRLGRALEEFNLTWFEEPLPPTDHAGEAKITATLDTPVASGESVYTSRGILEMLQMRACDIIMPDLQRMGGPTEFMKAAHYAEAFNIPVSNHCFTEMSMPLVAAIPNANWIEYMPWLEPVYKERIELNKDGHAVIPTAPGWGFSFDPAAIKKYAVK